jgi:ferric-dicitrate binding protein FerR (iron transport regulator)
LWYLPVLREVHNSILENMNKELLKKYLDNSCTDKEFEEFAGWVAKEISTKEGKSWGFDDWLSFEPGVKLKNSKKYSALLDKIHHEINLKDKREIKVATMGKVISWLSRVAAILFIPLLGVMFYMLSNHNIQTDKFTELAVDSVEVIAPIGSRSVVQLSDGSKVYLNYGSRIKYPRIFTGETREIALAGEGYFEVAHDPEKPFIVKAGKINVKALGTTFNVSAYPEDEIIATTLVEGKVVIEREIPGDKTESLGTMVPGQHVAYNPTSSKIHSTNGNIAKYIAWKDGKLIFDNEPITKVAEELSRMYNVDIEVADEIKEYTYTVTLVNDPLLLVLDLMTEVTDVRYKTYPRKKLADGTFSKLKIRIEKRK